MTEIKRSTFLPLNQGRIINSTIIEGTRYSLNPVFENDMVYIDTLDFISCSDPNCLECRDNDLNDCIMCDDSTPFKFTIQEGICQENEPPYLNPDFTYFRLNTTLESIDEINSIFKLHVKLYQSPSTLDVVTVMNSIPELKTIEIYSEN